MRSANPRVWSLTLTLFLPLTTSLALAQNPPETNPNQEPFPTTKLLEATDDLSARMLDGIDKFLDRQSAEVAKDRSRHWKRDFTSRTAYENSIQPNRDLLRRLIGAIDPRTPNPSLEVPGAAPLPPKVAETDLFTVYAVRWPTLPGVNGEGLLLEPKSPPVARIIAIPDADQTPEMLCGLAPGLSPEAQFARRLAEAGCQVLIPVLVDRSDAASGSPLLNRYTNQPHREWIYRQAYQLGRHVIGFEVQKLLAAADSLAALGTPPGSTNPPPKLAIAGYGEGGLLALHAAALDPRFESTLVSGYVDNRSNLWSEPIYRNIFGLLLAFNDAEIASLIAPRHLVVEYSEHPKVNGPPAARDNRAGAAPGILRTPERSVVEAEIARARQFFPTNLPFPLDFIYGNEGTTTGPGSDPALTSLLKGLGIDRNPPPPATNALADLRNSFDPAQRQLRTVTELTAFNRQLFDASSHAREQFFWNRLAPSPTNDWAATTKPFRDQLHNNLIGRLLPPTVGINPQSRRVLDKPKWLAYELTVDLYPDVYAWAFLLVPKDLRPGERRPVIVCQHDLEGLPDETLAPAGEAGYDLYKSSAARLADRGFIVLSPHNPCRGADRYRQLQRKANPLKATLFSVIAAQHDRLLEWLSDQPFVDPKRIALYGFGHGGATALRIPAVVDRYSLAITSSDFTDWARKTVLPDSACSTLYSPDYSIPEWNIANTFSHAELAALIAPRPFMVERSHDDTSSPDEWVAFEYAKVRRLYSHLGWPNRTDIEFYDGPPAINGIGTFQFLYKHLDWMRR